MVGEGCKEILGWTAASRIQPENGGGSEREVRVERGGYLTNGQWPAYILPDTTLGYSSHYFIEFLLNDKF